MHHNVELQTIMRYNTSYSRSGYLTTSVTKTLESKNTRVSCKCIPPQGNTILVEQSTIVPPVLRCNIQFAASSPFMDLVRCDETTHGCIHVMAFLTVLQPCADSGRHATYEVQSGVGIRAGGCSLMALADEVRDPAHESTYHHNWSWNL